MRNLTRPLVGGGGAALFRLDIAITFDFIGDYSVIPRVSFESPCFDLHACGRAGGKEKKKERTYTGLIPVNPIVLRGILSLLICRDVDNEYR